MTPWRLLPVLGLVAWAASAQAETVRIATFNTELSRDGPGLLLRDLTRGGDPQVAAVASVIAEAAADILVLQGIDWDAGGQTLAALVAVLGASGANYPHSLALRPNSGLATGIDMNGDGISWGPEDAQSYGRFTGQGGMAILSKLPIMADDLRDFSGMLWADLPGADLPRHPNGDPFPSAEAQAVQRLSSVGHWVVPVRLSDGLPLSLLAFHAAPPVFDGPEDRNGRRNADEIGFWQHFLDGAFGPAPQGRFVLVGDANLDPQDSDGRNGAIGALLSDRRLTDPAPLSDGAAAAGDQGHRGEDALDTVDWPKVGRLRVDYVLPSADLTLAGSGVLWPDDGQSGHDTALAASRHRLVWVDLLLH